MKQKNLLFVFADQWRSSALGYVREDAVFTPNMDFFCESSVVCMNAYSTFPLCTPHRASLLTGRYPLSMGMFTNCKIGLNMKLNDNEIGIGQVLKKNGYQTGYIGKWHLDEPEGNHEEKPASGARSWDAFTPPGLGRHGFDFWYSYGACDDHLEPHYWRDTPQMICANKWSPEHETDVAIDYIKTHEKEPFALYLSWNPPHSPYDQVPLKYQDLYDLVKLRPNVSVENLHHHTGEETPCSLENMEEMTKQYYAAISGLDQQFGRLIKVLKERGLYENTVIVLSSDHGDMMGSHGMMGKHVWYDESIKIPLVIGVPGKKARRCSTCIGSQDLMPTILGILGISIPGTVEGVDCSRAIVDGEEDLNKVCFLCGTPGRALFLQQFSKEKEKLIKAGWRGVRTQQYTYAIHTGYGMDMEVSRHLYDNQADPFQQQELNLEDAENKKIAKDFEYMIKTWTETYEDEFRLFQQEEEA